jgi:hypothetical protein
MLHTEFQEKAGGAGFTLPIGWTAFNGVLRIDGWRPVVEEGFPEEDALPGGQFYADPLRGDDGIPRQCQPEDAERQFWVGPDGITDPFSTGGDFGNAAGEEQFPQHLFEFVRPAAGYRCPEVIPGIPEELREPGPNDVLYGDRETVEGPDHDGE